MEKLFGGEGNCSALRRPSDTKTSLTQAKADIQESLAELKNVQLQALWIPAFAGMTFNKSGNDVQSAKEITKFERLFLRNGRRGE